MTKPNLPVPQPLRGTDPDSFAQNTVTVRLPNIVRRVLAENDFSPPVAQQLEALIDEIPAAQIRPLNNPKAPDAAQWAEYIAPYLGLDWLQIPWFLAETYLYRRVLDATGYFAPGDGYRVDPYAYQKQQGLETTRQSIARLSRQLHSWLESPDKRLSAVASLLMIDLWGNQADLSLWPAGDDAQPNHADLEAAQHYIVVDDSEAVVDYLAGRESRALRVDFIVDNAGFELVCDLALADFLLGSKLASTVVLHVKYHPTFVSDAMIKDVEQTINFLSTSFAQPAAKAFGQRLQAQREANQLQLQNDLFWTSPLSFWEMPVHVKQALAQADLLISKGDANYRRLLGDRHWPYTTPFADIVSYLPTPLVALRTFKSEVAAGLEPAQVQRLTTQDPNWLTNGKRGIIQFVE